jgi:diguanylate cyclase (GGDEF)-like protein
VRVAATRYADVVNWVDAGITETRFNHTEGSVVSDLTSGDRHVDATDREIDRQQDLAPASQAGVGDPTPAHMGDQAPAHVDGHRFTRYVHERSAEQRIEQRLRAAAAREAAAHARDAAATARDESAELHDRELAADAWSADSGRALTGADIVMRAAENRRRAAADRAAAAQIRSRSAADRKSAARDRDQAARDRLQAQADREALLHQLELAETDALTGVRTRAAGLADLEHEIERARRASAPLVVAYIDVVGLKIVNDTRGHTAGDALLQRVVRAVRDHMRCYDLLVRLGGDEFLCAMSGATGDDARKRFRAIKETLATGPDRCAIKVGFAALSPRDSADALIRRADAELPVTRRSTLRVAERERD